LKIRVGIKNELVPITDEQLFEYPLLFMHGRNTFKLNDTERGLLRKYVLERDGTLFADAICANKAFADAFRAEMQAIFRRTSIPCNRSPPTMPSGRSSSAATDLSKVHRRESLVGNPQGPIRVTSYREGPPELEGIKVGDRYAVIFSPYDLSCALDKAPVDRMRGLRHRGRERIGLNVIVYFLQGGDQRGK